jgi:outer membrane protein assembly factor BamD
LGRAAPHGISGADMSCRKFALLIAVAGTLAACGSNREDAYVERPVEELYNKAMDDMVDENYRTAARGFEEVDRQHPYSVWATKAQLMSAYAYY